MNTMKFVLYALVPMLLLQAAYALMQPARADRALSFRSLYPWLAVYWVAVVALRPFFMAPDDANYSFHLNYTTAMEGFTVINLLGHSPAYYWILGAFRRVFDDSERAILLLAGIASLIKFAQIGKITRWDALAALMYVGIFLVLHDMVQFRVALSLAFVLGGLVFLERRRWILAAATYAVSMFVHSQTAAFALVPIILLIFRTHYFVALGAASVALIAAAAGLAPPLVQFLPVSWSDRAQRAIDSVEVSGVGITAFLMLALTAAVTPAMKSADLVQRVAFYSVISGFIATWLTAATGASSRLAYMFWVPLCLLAPLARTNRVVRYTWIGGALAYFLLSTYINELLLDWRVY